MPATSSCTRPIAARSSYRGGVLGACPPAVSPRTGDGRSPISPPGPSPGRILSEAGRFALFETAAAHKAVERGGKVGTVVVEPQC